MHGVTMKLCKHKLGGEQTRFVFLIFCAQNPHCNPSTLFHVFHVFLVNSLQMLGYYHKLLHDCSLPRLFQLTTQ